MVLSLQTRKKYDKSPTFKIYTTSIRLVSYVAVIYFGPQGQREQRRINAAAAFLVTPPSGRGLVIPFFPWFLTPPSGRGLVIPFFFRGVFFGGHLPQISGFRSAKEILIMSFATQPRAFILSDRNIFYNSPGEGKQRRGLMPLGLFLFFHGH